ncbi:14026_t:CDS:2 [Cetraspora pellucida]|uniref:14026_t:CDS:1 n=1 Tax=Cetraspora pellucida TaxID=1433469 RepID=A0A9N9NBS1_9GLOM|nr:14026_t:CDS:2 [Cetraspora pellucida]
MYPDKNSNAVAIMNALITPITYGIRMQDNIPVKMFMSICHHLPPSDLLMMACVCKDFKNILDERINPLAGEIWRNSRNQFTNFKNRDPPAGMNQQTFARLLTFTNGCQFCKDKNDMLIVYWIPGVRSCKNCMLKRTFSSSAFRNNFKLDDEILGLIAPITPNINSPEILDGPKHYWISHVKNAVAFFMEADDNVRLMLNQLRKDVEDTRKESQNYHQWTSNVLNIERLFNHRN